jgi:membrane fusion protein (multidrug efflux system)
MNNPNPVQANGARRRGLLILGLVVAVCAVAYAARWWLVARHFQSTDDAYVGGDVVQITSEAPGTVIALNADDTQSVQRGQALVQLDPADANVAVGNAEANLARAVRQVRTQFSTEAQLKAQIAQRRVELKRAQDDYQRRAGLAGDGAVSGEELSHAKDAIADMRAALDAANEQLDATAAQVDGTTLQNNPQVLAAEAGVRDAALASRRTQIAAPVSGVVAHRSVQIGQRVAPGTPLMAVVPLDDVWVDANFKEVQLRNMRVGQPVTLRADLYGGAADYHGKVAGLSAGSGSAFALLPSQNASGNWIKIVQRVPVRVVLDPNELKAHPLRIGLSMTAEVDISDISGPLVASQVRSVPQPQQASIGADPAIEARIAQIIADNSSQAASAAARLTSGSGQP